MRPNSRLNLPVIAISSISLALLVAFQNCSGGFHHGAMPAEVVKEEPRQQRVPVTPRARPKMLSGHDR